ncbi:hypothetical protein HOF56_00835 [Candidatus Peribacteria bacterium]|jgi:hypothetical protein|nr:hypothetical protein [Candidatus Peribacteria bacterium]MBT4021623.1 hypothetical protein [Candidatus Peribacteria bacterium]MBT4240881.1 hypothetical protein [Candidatus Peribacteria bacterium]MBT4474104.1 hypothetical protein [Candidatus Peribacteria bacterium]
MSTFGKTPISSDKLVESIVTMIGFVTDEDIRDLNVEIRDEAEVVLTGIAPSSWKRHQAGAAVHKTAEDLVVKNNIEVVRSSNET